MKDNNTSQIINHPPDCLSGIDGFIFISLKVMKYLFSMHYAMQHNDRTGTYMAGKSG
jgi:hypothetical protein